MIRREVDDGICLLIFDRPEAGANVFDAATLRDLDEQLDFVEADSLLTGLILSSAKKSIFIAGADLKTLLRQLLQAARAMATVWCLTWATELSDLNF